jgi:quinol monooxygenase YgiN
MPYVVTATWTTTEGHQAVVLDCLQKLTGPSRQEPGCRFYQAYHDPAEPLVFHLFEIYDDEDAYKAHGASEHFQTYGFGQAIPVLAKRERAFYQTVDA